MIIVDTSAIVAALDADSDAHVSVAKLFLEAEDVLGVSPMVVAEADSLLSARLGDKVAERFLKDVSSGAYQLLTVDAADIADGLAYCQRYADLRLGITDALNAVLAQRNATPRVATLEHRHFRAIRPLTDHDAFMLLPEDEPGR